MPPHQSNHHVNCSYFIHSYSAPLYHSYSAAHSSDKLLIIHIALFLFFYLDELYAQEKTTRAEHPQDIVYFSSAEIC